MSKKQRRQAVAELGQAQVKLAVIVKVVVEDRCMYLILSELQSSTSTSTTTSTKVEISINFVFF